VNVVVIAAAVVVAVANYYFFFLHCKTKYEDVSKSFLVQNVWQIKKSLQLNKNSHLAFFYCRNKDFSF